MVFEDIDGNGQYDPFSEMGLTSWTIDLLWEGQLVTSTLSAEDGSFVFSNLGNTGTTKYSVCIHAQDGYVQTRPAGGMATGCSGTGYSFPINNPFMTSNVTNFGEMLQP